MRKPTDIQGFQARRAAAEARALLRFVAAALAACVALMALAEGVIR